MLNPIYANTRHAHGHCCHLWPDRGSIITVTPSYVAQTFAMQLYFKNVRGQKGLKEPTGAH